MIEDKIAKIEKIRKTYNGLYKKLPGDQIYEDWIRLIGPAIGILVAGGIGTVIVGYLEYKFNYKSNDLIMLMGVAITALVGFASGISLGYKIGTSSRERIIKKYKGLIDDKAVTVIEHPNNYLIYNRLTPRIFEGLTNKEIADKWVPDKICKSLDRNNNFISSKDFSYLNIAKREQLNVSIEKVYLAKYIENGKSGSKVELVTGPTKKITLDYIKKTYSNKNLYIKNAKGTLEHYKND
jgi:hypothetical protein